MRMEIDMKERSIKMGNMEKALTTLPMGNTSMVASIMIFYFKLKTDFFILFKYAHIILFQHKLHKD